MGAVYRAHNALVPDIVAAVKVLKPHALEDARERFFREVQAVHRLHHPNIVRVTGFGEDPQRGLLWMAMDLVEGGELGDRIQRGPTPAAEALHIFDGLVDALAHAHGLGVFHRDLKPGNVLIDSAGKAKLVDFGIAVQQGQARLTSTGLVVGTPAYLPPEVFDAEHVDPGRADVYAIGQMLHEVLIGHAAFPEDPTLSEGQRMGRLLAAKIKTEALDPGEAFSPQLRALVREATDPEPKTRIPSAEALRERIRRMGPETSWVRVDPSSAVAAPTYEPDDGPIVAATTVGGGFDPAGSTGGGSLAAPTMSLDDDLPPAKRKKRSRGWLVGLLVVLILGAIGVVVAVAGAGAGAWYLGLTPDVPADLTDAFGGADDDVEVVPGVDTDAGATDATETQPDTAIETDDTDEAPVEDTDPPTLVEPTDPTPPPPPPPDTATDISATPGFKNGWARSAELLKRCEQVYEGAGGRQVSFAVSVVVDKGEVVRWAFAPNPFTGDTARCLERVARIGGYAASVTGTGTVRVLWRGAIIHEGPPDEPDEPTTATLDQATVTSTIAGNTVTRRCMGVLKKEVRPAPSTVVLAVQVKPDGTASVAEVKTAGIESTRAATCLEQVVARLSFPKSAEGGRFDVSLTP